VPLQANGPVEAKTLHRGVWVVLMDCNGWFNEQPLGGLQSASKPRVFLRSQPGASGELKVGSSTRPTLSVEQPRTLWPPHRCG